MNKTKPEKEGFLEITQIGRCYLQTKNSFSTTKTPSTTAEEVLF